MRTPKCRRTAGFTESTSSFRPPSNLVWQGVTARRVRRVEVELFATGNRWAKPLDETDRIVARLYEVFAAYPRPPKADFCEHCHGPEDIAYFRTTALQDFDQDHAIRLLYEVWGHWENREVFRHFLPLLLDTLLRREKGHDMYPGHVLETLSGLGFAGWPAAEREAVDDCLRVLERVIEAGHPDDLPEWRSALAEFRS